uniref:phosphatidylinositol-3,4,5-trisphosphate 5-phosphatase n=1 Tax=Hucho hucho TaxID=62062 RepID=A0A4W5QX18_9TELE
YPTVPWHHGNITRSEAEDLLSKAARDGSFLLRDSESIQGAYALCVLLVFLLLHHCFCACLQASEGVPIQLFSVLSDLVETYYSPNMGLATHLQFPVQKEEEPEEEPEPVNHPPQLPPRNFSGGPSANGSKETHGGESRGSELACNALADTYLQGLQHIDMSNLPEEYHKSIEEYFHTSLSLDAEQVQNGNPTLPHLKKLTMGICKQLNSEISRTLPTLEAFQRILDQQLSPGIGRLRTQVGSSSFCELVRSSLQVKSELLGLTTKMFLKVDVESGKIYFKKSKDGPEDKYFVHNKILQLVKSQKVAKLVIMVETEKEKTLRKEFVFNDTKKREGFCQLLQQMKNKHSDKPEPDMITVFVGTWNMGNASPPHSIESWFQCKGQGKTRDDTADHIPHDIYVIGTQEDPLGEKEWIDTLKSALRGTTNISFKQIATQTLWNIRIVVLAKPEHENRISHIFSDSVKTGIANALGKSHQLTAVPSTHCSPINSLQSHQRNQNYVSILRFLNLGDKKLNPCDITHRFTHLFWFGDLNYRIELPSTEAESIVTKIKQQQYQELLCRDQLTIEKGEEKVFLHFDEEEITFPPTYRFERDTRERYAYTKAKATGTKYNLPSWCDRVLRKSYPLVHVFCQSYGCTNDIMTSDHSPVFSTFEVGVASQFVSKHDPNSVSQGGIKFMNCVATLMTKSKTKFFIEYHSSCLEKFVKSSEGENQDHSDGSIKVRFGNQLVPIISDPEYLLDQHIILCVKSTDCDESYGEKEGQLWTVWKDSLYSFHSLYLLIVSRSSGCCVLFNRFALPSDITNPSYMGVGYKSAGVTDRGWSYSMSPKSGSGGGGGVGGFGGRDQTHGSTSPKKTVYDHSAVRSATGKAADNVGKPAEMFDNPLYGSMGMGGGPRGSKDQADPQRSKDHLTPPDPIFSFTKPSDQDPDRPPVPTPRNRSYTCSETKPQSSATTASASAPPHPQTYTKNPVKPSRSEGGMVLTTNRPHLPMKSRPGQVDATPTKPKDYRDSLELPSKLQQAVLYI